ncbi:hypothetical protein GC173_14905 [bacterium]|nr:hypothetical protein [bacterium]
MKIIAIASAKGGSARTTTCVRLSQALVAADVPTGIVDLSPYPSVSYVLPKDHKGPVVIGRAAKTSVAVRSLLKPYEDSTSCMLLDTARLDDRAITPWLPMIDHFIVTLKIDKNSVRAMPSVWSAIDGWRSANPSMTFLGFLPVCVEPHQMDVLKSLRSRMVEHILPVGIPFHEAERLGPDLAPKQKEWDDLARHVMRQAGLRAKPPEVKPSSEVGIVSRMWRMAASVLGPRIGVTGGAKA